MIEQTLAERGARYGSFRTHALYVEHFLSAYEDSPNWIGMSSDSKQALRVIADKIARILNGDPEYDDNWRDISGYATLVLNRITGNEESKAKTKEYASHGALYGSLSAEG